MDIFLTGFITLLGVTALFYIVLLAFIYYWHLNIPSVIVVPIVFAFEVFWKCFVALAITSLILYYAQYIINLSGI